MTFLCVRFFLSSQNASDNISTSERLSSICLRNESSLVSFVISTTYLSNALDFCTFSIAFGVSLFSLNCPTFSIGFSLICSLTFCLCRLTCCGRTLIPIVGFEIGVSTSGTLPHLTRMIIDSGACGRAKSMRGTYSSAIRGHIFRFNMTYCCANARAAYTVGRFLLRGQNGHPSCSHPWRSM